MEEITRRRFLVRAESGFLGLTVAGCSGAAGSKETGKLRIPLANSFIGNSWRLEMAACRCSGGPRQRGGRDLRRLRADHAGQRAVLRQHRPLFQPFYLGLFRVLAVGASTLLGRMLRRRA